MVALVLLSLVVACASETASRRGVPTANYLYYQNGDSIWRVALRGQRNKVHILRVDSDIGGVATTSEYFAWASHRGCVRVEGGTPRLAPCNGLYRMNRDGSNRVRLVARLFAPDDIVVAGNRAYWIDLDKIGRVNLDGTNVERSFVRAVKEDAGGVGEALATDGTYLYFTRCGAGAIARVRLDGTGLDRTFISLGGEPCRASSLAYAAGYLHWGELDDNGRQLIGRATVDGKRVQPGWLDAGPLGGYELAAGAGMLFWEWGGGASSPSYIGQASLDGKILNRRFVVGWTADVGP